MARNRPFYPRFPCFFVPSPNQKRFSSVFKVSLNIMRQSDLASADVEIRKSDKELHLSGAPDCPVEQPAVWSFFLRSIVHSSFIHPYSAVWSNFGSSFRVAGWISSEHVFDPNLSTGDQGCRWLAVRLVAHWTTSLRLSPMSAVVFHFISWPSEPRLICRTAQGVLLRERHSGSNTNHLGSVSIILIVLFDRKLWLAFHLADPVVTASSSIPSVPMARRHLFGDCCISNCHNSSTSRAYSTQKGDTAPFSGGACSGEKREERHGWGTRGAGETRGRNASPCKDNGANWDYRTSSIFRNEYFCNGSDSRRTIWKVYELFSYADSNGRTCSPPISNPEKQQTILENWKIQKITECNCRICSKVSDQYFCNECVWRRTV